MSKENWIKFMETGAPEQLELIFGKKLAKKILRERGTESWKRDCKRGDMHE